MRLRHVAALAMMLAPLAAWPRPWQGITPGTSTQSDVSSKFGEPSTQGKLGGRSAMVYKGDQAIPGTKQAQFLALEDGTIAEINVFPATELDKEAVEGTYGKPTQKTFTDDFRPVWVYRASGVVVFFGKDGAVEAISFKPVDAAAPRAEAGGAPARSERAPQR
jgi:hypothetical protein